MQDAGTNCSGPRLAGCSVTATADCLSEYGAGCTNCVNVTLTGGRRLMQSGPTVAPQHARGGHQDGPGGRGGAGGGRPGWGSRSVLTCTACDTPGYLLMTETRGTVTLGRCGECSAIWCVGQAIALLQQRRSGSAVVSKHEPLLLQQRRSGSAVVSKHEPLWHAT